MGRGGQGGHGQHGRATEERGPQPQGTGDQAAEQRPDRDGAEPDQADGPTTRPISRSGTMAWRSDSRVTFHTPPTAPVAA